MNPTSVIWINPQQIFLHVKSVQLSKVCPGQILHGDWDLEAINLNFALPETNFDKAKVVSMLQRYNQNFSWGDTDIFKHFYSGFLKDNVRVRGFYSEPELINYYIKKYDPIFERFINSGIQAPSVFNPISFMYAHIGRDGDLLYSSMGNHRLGIAKAAKLDLIPIRILAIHDDWRLPFPNDSYY